MPIDPGFTITDFGLIEVLDLKWSARAGCGHGEGASFAIVEPLIGNRVAIRGWRLGTEVDALTAFGVSQGWEITQRLGFESNHAGSLTIRMSFLRLIKAFLLRFSPPQESHARLCRTMVQTSEVARVLPLLRQMFTETRCIYWKFR